MKEREKRVLVGMSGGIDSSAACIMLQEQGYEVVGVTMRTWDVASHFTPGNDQPNEVIEAQELAARLGIEHHVADVRTEFRQVIVQYFIDEYMRGRTPNPCVMCNPLFKERILCEWADKCNCAWIATGHYCQLKDLNGYRYILTGDDPLKDQSYFLWKLPQEILKRMMFPLGGMTKASVRDYLASKGFEAKARGGESMEICFIEKDYREFLKEHCPDIDERIGPGWFVDSKGLKLGQHKGFAYYATTSAGTLKPQTDICAHERTARYVYIPDTTGHFAADYKSAMPMQNRIILNNHILTRFSPPASILIFTRFQTDSIIPRIKKTISDQYVFTRLHVPAYNTVQSAK
jgi:tRNA-specific 2-thiouridylase